MMQTLLALLLLLLAFPITRRKTALAPQPTRRPARRTPERSSSS